VAYAQIAFKAALCFFAELQKEGQNAENFKKD
jgi:hypothetical protein